MFLHAADRRNDLDVGCRAEFQMNALALEMRDELWVFDASRSVTDALRLKQAKRLPDALGPATFPSMSRARQSMLARETIRANVSVKRESSLISRQIQRHHPAPSKLFDQFRREHALRFCKVPQSAKDHACLHSRFPNHVFN
jgi:hypothetical protein